MTAFHNNIILQRMIKILITKFNVTSFLETGTYCAGTTTYMALNYVDLPIFTCEINENYFQACSKRLSKYKNVTISKESSEKFIIRLIKEKTLGDFPMFFLDAHWYDYWPLQDEIANIGILPKFIILIDDFKVPNHPKFGNDAGGGGTLGIHRSKRDIRPCSMELIEQHLPLNCEVGYPNYDEKEVPGVSHFRGHAFVIRGLDDKSMEEIKENKYFTWGKI